MFKKTKVLMTKSVGPLEAGKHVKLDRDLADEFIVKGYAEGELSRSYSADERNALLGPTKVVGL